jgi:hypothetical protein
MDAGGLVFGNFSQNRAEGVRRRKIGVSEAEVEDLVCAVLGLEPGPFFEHFPDPGGPFDKPFDFFGDCHGVLSICILLVKSIAPSEKSAVPGRLKSTNSEYRNSK